MPLITLFFYSPSISENFYIFFFLRYFRRSYRHTYESRYFPMDSQNTSAGGFLQCRTRELRWADTAIKLASWRSLLSSCLVTSSIIDRSLSLHVEPNCIRSCVCRGEVRVALNNIYPCNTRKKTIKYYSLIFFCL